MENKENMNTANKTQAVEAQQPTTLNVNQPSQNQPLPDTQQQSQQSGQAQASAQTGVSAEPLGELNDIVQPKPKRKIPKVLMFLPLVFIIIFLIFLAIRFFPGQGSVVSKKGEIEWWGFREDETIVASLIDEYQKRNPNIKVIYRKQSPIDYRERLTNALTGEQGGPDLFEIHNTWTPMYRDHLDVAKDSIINKEEFKRDFYPAIVSDLLVSDGVIGIPIEFDTLALFVNDDVFASTAKTPPTTWDELRSLSVELTQRDRKGVVIRAGVPLGITQNIDHWQEILALMMIQNGANLARTTDRKNLDAARFYRSFRSDRRVWDKRLPVSTVAFARGDVAMYFGPSWRSYEITQINPNLKFHTVPMPQLPKDKPSDPNFSYAIYWYQGIWTKSANKDLAWDFLKFLSSKDSLEKININYKDAKGVDRLYPRIEMNKVYKEHPLLGSLALLANDAKTWYLADVKNDGETGINTSINLLYENLITGSKGSPDTIEKDLISILSGYGISTK